MHNLTSSTQKSGAYNATNGQFPAYNDDDCSPTCAGMLSDSQGLLGYTIPRVERSLLVLISQRKRPGVQVAKGVLREAGGALSVRQQNVVSLEGRVRF